MTEIFINCKIHGRTHVKELDFTGYIYGECGCNFLFNSGYIRNLTKEHKDKENRKYIDDHKGGMYQDGSREFEGIMLQDGSYI